MTRNPDDFSLNTMLSWQKQMMDAHPEWMRDCPENGGYKLLWMTGELGEVIDVLKKNGVGAVMNEPDVRAHFTEELSDVLMYFSDVLLSYGITPAELRTAYRKKVNRHLPDRPLEED
ncbi:MAG: nucleotide pyrophosphohydrolase [Clostridia bacterium]|nr:nucleotide pyrophosphohydrolase [Clostridia bacterium]